MNSLYELLHSLDEKQVKVLKNYLTSFSPRDENTKLWELCGFLLANKTEVPGLEACSMKLYKTEKDCGIRRLKNRLYSKVMDSLLIDINTNRNVYEDDVHPIQIRLRKKMMMYDLIKFTPLKHTIGMEMINDIIVKAKQYEFHSILLEALYIYKGNYGLRKGPEFLDKMSKEIAHFERCKQYAQRALDLYSALSMYPTFETKTDNKKIEQFLENSIAELRQNYLETKTKSVGYYLKTFEMTLLQLQKDHAGAREIAISMIEFLMQNKAVSRKGRFGVAYATIAQIELELGNYNSAFNFLTISEKYFPADSLNLAIYRKLKTDALFLKGDYEGAKEIASSLATDDSIVTGEFRRDIMLYYKACCHFMLGEHKAAGRLLNLKFQLKSDKLGWEVNIRIMRIINNIEMGHYDASLKMLEAHYKHIRRYRQLKDLSERDKMILRLFLALAKAGFEFNRPNAKIYQLLLQLQETGKPHSWEALTPELIPIHKWLIKKYGRFFSMAGKIVRVEKKKKKYPTAAKGFIMERSSWPKSKRY